MIHVFDDARPWGKHVAAALNARGAEAKLFSKPTDLARADRLERVVFFPRHHPEDRDRHKEMARALWVTGFRTIPSPAEIEHYDDKIAQLEILRPFLPETYLFRDPDDARAFASRCDYPLFSKAAQGAGSNNVRLVANRDIALREVSLAFDGDGVPCSHGARQKGYLYWQAGITTPHDWRVVVLGLDTALLVKRWNRPDRPMASSSGNIEMQNAWGPEHVAVVEYAREVCEAARLTFTGLDIVGAWDGFRTLEASCCFGPISNYSKGVFFRRHGPGDWRATEYSGREFFDLVAELICEGKL